MSLRRPFCLGFALFGLTLFGSPALLSGQSKAGLYDIDTLRSFYFTFTSQTWYADLANAWKTHKDVKGDLVVDGVKYKDVGVRFRGASSYLGSGTKKSINVNMDKFVAGQDLMGYDSLNLSNGFNDPTFCREVLAYGILRKYMPAPKANYVRVYVNNGYFGLFVNVQQPEGRFISEWYKDNDGNRYRCDAPTSAGYGKSALQWLGTTLKNYQDAYELKTDLSKAVKPWEDIRSLCNVLNNTPNNKLEAELPKLLDVDQALWYLALNIVMVNLDSYAGRGNDYYLYHETRHDKMMMLPWDMNESFGGYSAGMTVPQRMRVSPYYNQSNSKDHPLLGKLFGVVPEWKARYFHHVKEVLDSEFHWRNIGPLVSKYQQFIDAALKADPHPNYSYQKFKDNVTKQMVINTGFFKTEIPGLKQICDGREAYIKGLAEYKAARPNISNLVAPQSPKANTVVTITAKVTNTAAIGPVTLYYRNIGLWQTAPMFDDGKHGDGAANDGVFGGFVPAALQRPGHRVQYYIGAQTASAGGGAASYLPTNAAFQAPSYVVAFPTGQSPISINEVLAINKNGIKDQKAQTEDWLELYNASSNPVKVGGMYLTDDSQKPTKWQIPSTYSIPGNSTLLVWCDDEPADGPLHAKFKLNGNGEKVWLFDTNGKTLLSKLEFGPQTADVSNGWLFDGKPATLVAYKTPSPRKPNSQPCSARGYSPVDHGAHRIGLEFLGVPRIAGPKTSLAVSNGPIRGTVMLFLASAPGVQNLGNNVYLMLGGPLLGPLVLPTDASGAAQVPVTIPNDSNLKGTAVYLQVGGTDSRGFTVSNGVEVRICN